MAFGIELGGDYGKLLLSVFRIVAVGFISYYLYIIIKQKKSYGLIASISLIWAGAVGNRAIGTAAAGGMLTGTLLGIFIIPGLYFLFASISEKLTKKA
jgi:uncharacterized membrane protein